MFAFAPEMHAYSSTHTRLCCIGCAFLGFWSALYGVYYTGNNRENVIVMPGTR